MERQAYPSDVTDGEWAILAAYIPAPLTGGRPAKWKRREIVNAILYVLRTGCQWRSLPHDFPRIRPYLTISDVGAQPDSGQDIGGVVALLLAPESHWITGQRIEVTGGFML